VEERVTGVLSMATIKSAKSISHHLTMLVEVHPLIWIHSHLYQFCKTIILNEPNKIPIN